MTARDFTKLLRELPILATKEYCRGKTFIVTGANVGLGREASRHLVSLEASRVIMAVRNVSAGEEAKASIEASTGVGGVAQVWKLDLSSYDSVKAFAAKAVSELDRIDACIHNAAVAETKNVVAEGHFIGITVNVIGTHLLGMLLFPKMKEDAKKFNSTPHMAFVSSGAGFGEGMKEAFDAMQDDPISGIDRGTVPFTITYPITKLLETLSVRHLARLLPVSDTGVIINIVCPGICETELGRHSPPEFKDHLQHLHKTVGRTADHGSRTLLHGAVAGVDSHGRYLDTCEFGEYVIPFVA
ncbi:putative short chain dehydrogenase/ reductase [Stachybotrys elegans]|uniref:Short chain dehydrogenase/ reductase n=1 Tax=Stachybotrys elegans TaxID=80388 RepID=A0A8K0T4A3_9HYPO|nr:putative short chain dehydrogenase/ reductase [Stachybotrys elegans]